ncbi:sensor domain-containing diguanylate cyclase [Stenotrophomonas sp. UBA7606]|uniref:sensor domain-containing diguanylate cyclase n=1 Tax=Stenotrophomonas sp. UBA7606 TaxID=1947559 RepID=UPI0026012721|nr:sensor domain-containing diguanylate cyclase [Stenotrophomonas sp. UBA7606]
MDLRKLILVLTFLGALVPFANTFYASYTVQRQQLMDATLDSNYAYASKLAKSTEDFLQASQLQLAYTAQLLATQMDDVGRLGGEATRLRMMSKSFNSITIFDATGKVLATSPEALGLQGRVLNSEAVKAALREKRPLISAPYQSATGNFIVFINHPIVSPAGQYLGAVGGAIYLQKENILDRLLGQHFYVDGSYLFVVDRQKRIIYHPDPQRIGDFVENNAVVDRVAAGESGKGAAVNSHGVSMLAGYAPVASTGWGIVAQRPQAATLAPLTELMLSTLYKALPAMLLTLAFLLWSARLISRPLRLLADGARKMDDPASAGDIRSVKSWYFESRELKKAMLMGIDAIQKSFSKLREDTATDPLTQLGNRRRMDDALRTFESQANTFSVISLDIDHFKAVNDTYGHDAGDEALRCLAQRMREACRAYDVPLRVGGEEFLILLPSTTLATATQVAERLRRAVEEMKIPRVGSITVSLGVANWPQSSFDIEAVLKTADEMLYASKRGGRNRVSVRPSGSDAAPMRGA